MADPRTVAVRIDATLAAVELAPAGDERIRAALRRGPPEVERRARIPVLAAVAALFGILLGMGIGLHVRTQPAARSELAHRGNDVAAPQQSGWVAIEPSCRTRSEGGVMTLEGPCEMALMQPPMKIHVLERARLIPTTNGVDVLEGWIAFDVDPVAEGSDPVRVGLPSGSIEVLGTRFTVWTDGRRGHVDLLEGRIRFHGSRGLQNVQPGQRVVWDEQIEPAPASPPPARAPTPPAAAPLREPVRQIARLRSMGRHAEALELVDRLLAHTTDSSIAEALSFEKGTLLQATGQRAAACRHFDKHLARFDSGRTLRVVAQRRDALGCDP